MTVNLTTGSQVFSDLIAENADGSQFNSGVFTTNDSFTTTVDTPDIVTVSILPNSTTGWKLRLIGSSAGTANVNVILHTPAGAVSHPVTVVVTTPPPTEPADFGFGTFA